MHLSNHALDTINGSQELIQLETEIIEIEHEIISKWEKMIESCSQFYSFLIANSDELKSGIKQSIISFMVQNLMRDIFDNSDDEIKSQAFDRLNDIENQIAVIKALGDLIKLSKASLAKFIENSQCKISELEKNKLKLKRQYQAWLNSIEVIAEFENDPCESLQIYIKKSIENLEGIVCGDYYVISWV